MATSTLVTAPTSEPITLAEAKVHLRVDEPDLDAAIASQIIAARHLVESSTRRALMQQTWDFKWDWNWPSDAQGPRIDPPAAARFLGHLRHLRRDLDHPLGCLSRA